MVSLQTQNLPFPEDDLSGSIIGGIDYACKSIGVLLQGATPLRGYFLILATPPRLEITPPHGFPCLAAGDCVSALAGLSRMLIGRLLMNPLLHRKIYLYINAVLYLVFGVWCAAAPEWTATAVGFALPGAQGIAEYVAVYGGLEFGVGAFLLICARNASLVNAGILFGACFYVGLFCFRTIAIAQVGTDIGAGLNFYIAEFVFMLWSLYLYRGTRASA